MSKQKQNPDIDMGFYASTPRIVRTHYRNVTPIQKWLYTCLKDLCGDDGTCYRTLRVLSEETGISIGLLSESIPVLHAAGLIHAEKKKRATGGKEVWHITIVDIWQANGKTHPTKRSQDEQKNVHNTNVHDVNIHNVNQPPEECSPREPECSQILDRSNNTLSKNITEERTIESSGKSAERTTGASALSLDARSQSENDNHSYSPSDATTPEPAPSESEPDSARLQESLEGEPPHAHTLPGSTHRDTPGLSSGALPGVSRGNDSTTPDTTVEVAHGLVGMAAPGHPVRVGDTAGTGMGSGCDTGQDRQVATPGARPVLEASEKIDALSRAWQEIGDSAHEDILQVLRPSGVSDDSSPHGANGHGSLPGLGAAGTADVSLVAGAQRWDASRREEVGVRAVGATGEGRAADGRLDGKGDNDNDTTTTTTHLPADRPSLLYPGAADRDTGGQPAEKAIEQTSSSPPTVELRVEPGDSTPAPVPSVVPTNDHGTTPNSPVSPLTTSTVVQDGALPASSSLLSPTTGQGTTFLAGVDIEAKDVGDEKPKTPAPLSEPDMSGKWSNERLVQYAEWCNDKRYTDKMREEQLKAAQAIHKNDTSLTLEQFKQAYDERNDDWWQEHKKKLHVSDMKARGKSGIDRVHEMLQHIEDRATRNKSKANLRLVPKAAETNQPTTNIRELVRQQEAARAAQVQ